MMKKNRELICLGDHDWYEVVIHKAVRHPRCHLMESIYDLGWLEIDYTVLDMEGKRVDSETCDMERIEAELQEIYA
jgi:hypothetical protein